MLSTTVGRFRVISLAEGCSFVLLLVFGSLLSRVSDVNLVMPLGILHAVLFLSFLLVLLDVRTKLGWDAKMTGIALIAGILPLGPFVFDHKMKGRMVEPAPTAAA